MYKRFTKSWMKHVDFIFVDLVCLYVSYFGAYIIWHGSLNEQWPDIYNQMIYVLAITSFCVTFVFDNHKNILRRDYAKELKFVFIQTVSVTVCISTYLFLTKNGNEFSRMTFGISMVLYAILMYLARNAWKAILNNIGIGLKVQKAILLITSSAYAEKMVAKVQEKQTGLVKYVGLGLNDTGTEGENIRDIPVVAVGETQILEYIQNSWVDEILIYSSRENPVTKDLVEKCEIMGVTVHQCLELETSDANVQVVERFCGYTVLTTCVQSATPFQSFCKRTLDIIGGLVGMLLTGVLVVIIGPMIFISSPGPIFFSQVRVGCGGRKFKIYKFRSMYMDAEERKKDLMDRNQMQGLMFKMDNDPRIIGSGPDGTKKGLGWFIRKTSIDEFPQFWNVFKGDMSLVGTRPPTVNEWEEYEYHHRSRLAIKPGITGLWQVSGRSEITDFEEVVRLDMQYIHNWSLTEDVKIIFKTILVVLGCVGSK